MNTANNTPKIKRNATWYTAKVIRVLTVPPIMALLAFSSFWLVDGFYKSVWEYVAAVAFIAVLPLCAYPLQLVIPYYKRQGRDGQRNLAFVMSTVGYVLGLAYSLIFSVSPNVFVMFITYFLSGLTLLIINKAFKFKASGHSCGLLGPLSAIVYFVSPYTLPAGLVVFGLSLWSSVYMKRHTLAQFIVGGFIPVIWLIICSFLIL